MNKTETIGTLLQGLDLTSTGDPTTPICGLAYDSRQVEPGFAFVAVPGFVVDGFDFVAQAIARGAAAVVSERSADALDGPHPAFWARTDDARALLATLACRWHDHPSHDLRVVGVTGTNGKTTVTALAQSLLQTLGGTGRWSTTRLQIAGESFPTPRTTPEALELQSALARMRAAGDVNALVEVSSHALVLHRVDGMRFAAAVFTNLSPDHLDFHRTMEAYLDAKALLFERLRSGVPAVINASDPAGIELARRCSGRVVRYGWEGAGRLDYALRAARSRTGGLRLALTTPNGSLDLDSPMLGRANAENIAAAVATALELGVAPESVGPVVASFAGEPGRLEPVQAGQAFAVLVDFAHTPGALSAAIEAARGAVADHRRLIVVFGCGGDRDRGKRPQMGAIAAEGAEVAIITSDNPRSEPPGAIIDQILGGIPASLLGRIRVERDRREAIRLALECASEGDCVLIAGKGHETEQLFADGAVEFDDRTVAAELLASLAGKGSAQ